jgi:hypothetical protein
MNLRYVTIGASWLEIVVGALFLATPYLPCVLVFGAKPDSMGMAVARFAGIALIGLGIACLPSRAASHRGSLVGLFGFNLGATVLFTWISIAAPQHGILSLPAAILHAVIVAALVPGIRNKASAV